MDPKASAYDDYADAYAAYVARRDQGGVNGDPMGILPHLLALLGDVTGRAVLDAGCGDGYLARILAGRGARVTGIDLSRRLIALACAKAAHGALVYRVADLSTPLSEEEAGRFDAVASYMVLNDVEDYRGFAATLAAALAPGGRLVLAFNSPHGFVIRKKVPDYFDTAAVCPSGLGQIGVPVPVYHRTLGDYLDAFLGAGLRLTKLVGVPEVPSVAGPDTILPAGYQFPRFMLLAFVKS